jgi:hypothetical protein
LRVVSQVVSGDDTGRLEDIEIQSWVRVGVFFVVLDAAGWTCGVRLDRSDPLYLACVATGAGLRSADTSFRRDGTIRDREYLKVGAGETVPPMQHCCIGNPLVFKFGS